MSATKKNKTTTKPRINPSRIREKPRISTGRMKRPTPAADHWVMETPESVRQEEAFASREVMETVRGLSKLQTYRSTLAILFDWAVVAFCFHLSLLYHHPVVWILSAIVIAGRQHGMLLLMHDASHYRISKNRTWNDLASNLFLSWPLFVSTQGYRRHHLAHHSHLNTDQDPDFTRKHGHEDWEFPKTKWGIFKLLLRDLCGGGVIENIKAVRTTGKAQKPAASKAAKWKGLLTKYSYYGMIITVLVMTGMWKPVLLLWYLPGFTVLPVIMRIRSIAEHWGMDGDDELTMSRNYHLSPIGRFLLAPHNGGLHLDHHLFPSVPFYNLQKLHYFLMTIPGYAGRSHQTYSVLGSKGEGLLKELTENARPMEKK